MTEAEAKIMVEAKLRCMELEDLACIGKGCDRDCDACKYNYMQGTVGEHKEALRMAINALEEIQRYRVIGTVEGFERAIQSSIENYNLYREYKAKVQEVAKEYMHSCYDCEWECLDGCSLRRDSNGNTEPVCDGLTDCKDFVPIAPYQKGE
jgi:hypothetical protein